MPYGAPTFDEPRPLGDGRTWTAKYDSFDERHYNLYYVLHVTELDGTHTRLVAQLSWDDGAPASAEADAAIEVALRAIALAGKSNTDYHGYGP